MNRPLYTIALPCYNDKGRIEKAVLSCLAQDTLLEFEVLVVDNASSDGTDEILDSISDNRLRVVRNKKTVSIFANHNRCLEEAKGKYVLFCHSDDTLLKSAIEIVNTELQHLKYPEQIVL